MNVIQEKEIRIAKLKKALEKYGIYDEEQLNAAIKEMKPLNIGCMVSPVPSRTVLEVKEC